MDILVIGFLLLGLLAAIDRFRKGSIGMAIVATIAMIFRILLTVANTTTTLIRVERNAHRWKAKHRRIL